jgi:hypothetical protein
VADGGWSVAAGKGRPLNQVKLKPDLYLDRRDELISQAATA